MQNTEKGRTRISISIDNKMLKRIDQYSESMGLTRSSAISVLAGEHLDQKEAIKGTEEMLKLYQKNEETIINANRKK